MVFDNYIFMVMNTPFFQSFKQHFFCFVQQQKRIEQNLYHLLYNQTSFGNLGYDRSAVLLSCRRRRDRKKPRSRFTASVARKRILVDERSSALCLGLTSVAIQ